MSAPESDWSRLSPRRPIEPDGAGYVVRPWFGAKALVEKVRATGGAWLVVGAAGSGKSSELACAAKLWRDDKRGLALLARLDRFERRDGSAAERLAGELARAAIAAKLVVPRSLRRLLVMRGVLDAHHADRGETLSIRGGRELVAEVWRHIAAQAERPPLVLVDGLEKVEPAAAKSLLLDFFALRDAALFVATAPAAVTLGGQAHALFTEGGARVFALPAAPVHPMCGDAANAEARAFLTAIVRAKLGPTYGRHARAVDALMPSAARASAGLPRTLLQLLSDAAGYATLAARAAPSHADLEQAIGDERATLARLVREGDRHAFRVARQGDGSNLELGRRVRLISQGLLLEYQGPDGPRVEPHLLLEDAASDVRVAPSRV